MSDSQYLTTFEIRRKGFLVFRLEQDTTRHGHDEALLTFGMKDPVKVNLKQFEEEVIKRKKLNG